jgi:membrane protein YqaA with SNARE-associated domain
MDLIRFLIDFILHIDVHLAELVANYGVWVYAILFLILFCETGLVVTPFLPGDSLLFVAGALSALPTNDLNVHLMVVLMVIAAIVGDALNYTIGRLFGEKLFSNPIRRFSVVATWIKPIRSMSVTAVKRLFLRVLCRSSEPSRRLWREWAICPIVILQRITWLARCCGFCCLPTQATCLAICRSFRKT